VRTLEDLRQFYNTTLLADLNALEGRRKAIVQKLTFTGAAVAVAVFIALFFVAQKGVPLFPGLLFPLIIGAVLFGFIAHRSSGKQRLRQRIQGHCNSKDSQVSRRESELHST
jgi:peptidoglycan/LPS O-acetylase OafA/YrhL